MARALSYALEFAVFLILSIALGYYILFVRPVSPKIFCLQVSNSYNTSIKLDEVKLIFSSEEAFPVIIRPKFFNSTCGTLLYPGKSCYVCYDLGKGSRKLRSDVEYRVRVVFGSLELPSHGEEFEKIKNYTELSKEKSLCSLDDIGNEITIGNKKFICWYDGRSAYPVPAGNVSIFSCSSCHSCSNLIRNLAKESYAVIRINDDLFEKEVTCLSIYPKTNLIIDAQNHTIESQSSISLVLITTKNIIIKNAKITSGFKPLAVIGRGASATIIDSEINVNQPITVQAEKPLGLLIFGSKISLQNTGIFSLSGNKNSNILLLNSTISGKTLKTVDKVIGNATADILLKDVLLDGISAIDFSAPQSVSLKIEKLLCRYDKEIMPFYIFAEDCCKTFNISSKSCGIYISNSENLTIGIFHNVPSLTLINSDISLEGNTSAISSATFISSELHSENVDYGKINIFSSIAEINSSKIHTLYLNSTQLRLSEVTLFNFIPERSIVVFDLKKPSYLCNLTSVNSQISCTLPCSSRLYVGEWLDISSKSCSNCISTISNCDIN